MLVQLLFCGESFSGLKWPFLCSLFIAWSRERKGGRGRREEGKGAGPKKIQPSRAQDSGTICFIQS